MKTYLRILKYAWPYKWHIFFNLFFTILAIVFTGIAFPMLQPVFDLLFQTEEIPAEATRPEFALTLNYLLELLNYIVINVMEAHSKEQALTYVIIFIVLVRIIGNVFLYLSSIFMTIIRTKTIEDLRSDLFNKMIALPVGWFEGERKGDIMTRLSSDVNEVENSVVTTFESAFRDPFTIMFYVAMMFMISVPLTLFVFALLPVTALIIGYIARSLKKDAYNAQGRYGEMMSLMEETLTGMRIVKAFGAENYIRSVFGRFNSLYSYLSRKQFYKKKLAPPFSEVAGIITVALILWFGGREVLAGNMEASPFIIFILLFSQILKPAKKFSGAFGNIYKGIASGERVFQLMDAPVSVKEKKDPLTIDHLKQGIAFKNVSFGYGKKYVLKNINLEIPKGGIIAVAGPSGSGKSTLAELILRFYDPAEGDITVDGHNINEYKVADLRNIMGLVSQEPILFNDTIHNNIAFGLENIDRADVENAAKLANAHDFITEQPDGYETNIGDGGKLLSGGQRQRVSIARALLKNPDFLILDEATSALDSASEKMVQDALYRLMENRTCLIIAHRLSTIKDAGEVIVLSQGKIVQRGPHSELVKQDGLYRSLYMEKE